MIAGDTCNFASPAGTVSFPDTFLKSYRGPEYRDLDIINEKSKGLKMYYE